MRREEMADADERDRAPGESHTYAGVVYATAHLLHTLPRTRKNPCYPFRYARRARFVGFVACFGPARFAGFSAGVGAMACLLE